MTVEVRLVVGMMVTVEMRLVVVVGWIITVEVIVDLTWVDDEEEPNGDEEIVPTVGEEDGE